MQGERGDKKEDRENQQPIFFGSALVRWGWGVFLFSNQKNVLFSFQSKIHVVKRMTRVGRVPRPGVLGCR